MRTDKEQDASSPVRWWRDPIGLVALIVAPVLLWAMAGAPRFWTWLGL